MEENLTKVKCMMKYNDFHYYIFDKSFYRVPVSHEEQTAEQYDKYHGFLPADRDQILCHGKRITFEEYIRGKTKLDLAGTSLI